MMPLLIEKTVQESLFSSLSPSLVWVNATIPPCSSCGGSFLSTKLFNTMEKLDKGTSSREEGREGESNQRLNEKKEKNKGKKG